MPDDYWVEYITGEPMPEEGRANEFPCVLVVDLQPPAAWREDKMLRQHRVERHIVRAKTTRTLERLLSEMGYLNNSRYRRHKIANLNQEGEG
jgi:hypothetical protein